VKRESSPPSFRSSATRSKTSPSSGTRNLSSGALQVLFGSHFSPPSFFPGFCSLSAPACGADHSFIDTRPFYGAGFEAAVNLLFFCVPQCMSLPKGTPCSCPPLFLFSVHAPYDLASCLQCLQACTRRPPFSGRLREERFSSYRATQALSEGPQFLPAPFRPDLREAIVEAGVRPSRRRGPSNIELTDFSSLNNKW